MSVQLDTLKDAAEVRVVRFLFSLMIFFLYIIFAFCQTDLLSAGRDGGEIQEEVCFKEGGGGDEGWCWDSQTGN